MLMQRSVRLRKVLPRLPTTSSFMSRSTSPLISIAYCIGGGFSETLLSQTLADLVAHLLDVQDSKRVIARAFVEVVYIGVGAEGSLTERA